MGFTIKRQRLFLTFKPKSREVTPKEAIDRLKRIVK